MANPTWRGVRVCSCMTAPLDEVARLVTVRTKAAGVPDWTLTPIQGAYSTAVGASAGTHAGGGALDLSTSRLSAAQKAILEAAMREVGFASWNREPSWWSAWFGRVINGGWSPHNHSILNGCPHVSAAATAQLVEYRTGENGLAGRDKDTGVRSFVGRTWAAYLAIRDAVVNVGKVVVSAAKSGTSTANIAVTLNKPIRMSSLQQGKRGTDVSRYQAALWNRLPGAVRQEFITRYGLKRTDLYDGVYGKVTAAMTARLYVLIKLPSATEPGPKMMRHLGFTDVR